MRSHSLLHRIFPTQGSNPSPYISFIGRQVLHRLHHLGMPQATSLSEQVCGPTPTTWTTPLHVCLIQILVSLAPKVHPSKCESESHSVVSHSLRPHGCKVSSVHGILQARILEWVAIPSLQRIFPIQGSNSSFLHCRQLLYHRSHQGSLMEP